MNIKEWGWSRGDGFEGKEGDWNKVLYLLLHCFLTKHDFFFSFTLIDIIKDHLYRTNGSPNVCRGTETMRSFHGKSESTWV